MSRGGEHSASPAAGPLSQPLPGPGCQHHEHHEAEGIFCTKVGRKIAKNEKSDQLKLKLIFQLGKSLMSTHK